MTQQTERDEALIAEKKRLADELERMYNGAWADDAVTLRHAAAVLRRHFEPPSEVVEAAEMVQRLSEGATAGTYYASAKAIADFILKGDQ